MSRPARTAPPEREEESLPARDPETIEAVLLDMGGVLLDFAGTNALPAGGPDYRGRLALAEAVRRAGGRVEAEALEELVFGPWHRVYERRYETMRDAPWGPHLARLREAAWGDGAGEDGTPSDEELLAVWFEPYRQQVVTVLPGAPEAVAALSAAGIPLALVSNVPLPGNLYRGILDAHGMLDAFAHTFFSYDAGHRKPSPAMLTRALEALGVPAARALMVGDRRSTDVAAGRAAGCRTVWIRSADRKGPEPDFEVDDIRQVPALVGALQSPSS